MEDEEEAGTELVFRPKKCEMHEFRGKIMRPVTSVSSEGSRGTHSRHTKTPDRMSVPSSVAGDSFSRAKISRLTQRPELRDRNCRG